MMSPLPSSPHLSCTHCPVKDMMAKGPSHLFTYSWLYPVMSPSSPHIVSWLDQVLRVKDMMSSLISSTGPPLAVPSAESLVYDESPHLLTLCPGCTQC